MLDDEEADVVDSMLDVDDVDALDSALEDIDTTTLEVVESVDELSPNDADNIDDEEEPW
jgi:hypothetical protein